jgi:hypothetical protein
LFHCFFEEKEGEKVKTRKNMIEKELSEEIRIARSLKYYLHKKFFPEKDFDIKIDIKNIGEWSDVNVYKKGDKETPVMLVETKSVKGNMAEAMGQAMWQSWEIYKDTNQNVPTYIAVPHDLQTKNWNAKTVKEIFEHFKVQIGILVQEKNRKQVFKIVSDPLHFLGRGNY